MAHKLTTKKIQDKIEDLDLSNIDDVNDKLDELKKMEKNASKYGYNPIPSQSFEQNLKNLELFWKNEKAQLVAAQNDRTKRQAETAKPAEAAEPTRDNKKAKRIDPQIATQRRNQLKDIYDEEIVKYLKTDILKQIFYKEKLNGWFWDRQIKLQDASESSLTVSEKTSFIDEVKTQLKQLDSSPNIKKDFDDYKIKRRQDQANDRQNDDDRQNNQTGSAKIRHKIIKRKSKRRLCTCKRRTNTRKTRRRRRTRRTRRSK